MSPMSKRLFASFLVLSLICSLLVSALPASAAPQGKAKKLAPHDQALLDQARAEGKTEVTLLIAAEKDQNAAVVQGVQALGGEVETTSETIDYVQATVPIEQAEAVLNVKGVETLGLDEVIPLEDPRPQGIVDPTPQPAPGAQTPNANPYMPTVDTKAAEFIAKNPLWDGRGTTVAIVDSGVDLDHPALQTTTTGEKKIVDWVTFTNTGTDGDPTWLNMSTTVSGATFAYKNVTYTAPADGTYRIGVFAEGDTRLGGEVGSDVTRDGDKTDVFGVLWNQATNNVYVDANQNNNFADDKPMTDYKVRNDVGYFGTDNPQTGLRETMAFVVQTFTEADGTRKGDFINIGIVSGAHGSHVAGIVAANNMFGGAMTGAAPGAKLVSIRVCLFISGCTASALINGMVYAVETAKVDLINMSIGGLPALNAGENNGTPNTRAILYNRLIEEGGVQMFISAGNNGPGVNTIGDPSVAGNVMSVGSSISDATWRSNYGSDSQYPDNLHNYSSRGPREDGGFKPNIVAPGSAISTVPTWQPGGPVTGVYELPAGYAMFNGTSMASPQAAGAAALLLSAAKQTGVDARPAKLRQAINSTARFLDPTRFKAYDQGNGLIDVSRAWDLLLKKLEPVNITAEVPVNTVLSSQLAKPGIGTGIYDREGVKPNTTYVRQYTFTRTSGDTKPVLYHLRWVGDTGTFQAPNTVQLPLNQPVKVDVTVKAGAPGSYAAILNLENSSTKGVEFQTMNTVIVADEFNATNNFGVAKTGTVGRNQMLHFFYRVPANTPAMKIDLTHTTGQIRFLAFNPYGLSPELTGTNSLQCYVPAVPGNTCNGASRTFTNPQPGVWEITVDTRRTSDAAVSNFTLNVSLLGATAGTAPTVIETAQANVPVERTLTFQNAFGTFTGNAQSAALDSAKVDRPTIANGASSTFTVVVDPGSTTLTARIGNPSDVAADLDLFVKDAAGRTIGSSADGDSEEAVTVRLPANFTGGTYTIQIDGYAVPSGSTQYDYLDVFANTKFGTVAVNDPVAQHPAGSSWTVPAIVTAKAAPAAGRILRATVPVVTDGGATIGGSEVRVLNVAQ